MADVQVKIATVDGSSVSDGRDSQVDKLNGLIQRVGGQGLGLGMYDEADPPVFDAPASGDPAVGYLYLSKATSGGAITLMYAYRENGGAMTYLTVTAS